MPGKTTIAIDGERFLINGRPTYADRSFRDAPIEGLLMNVRAVQATFDDQNPAPATAGPTPIRAPGTRSATWPSFWPRYPPGASTGCWRSP